MSQDSPNSPENLVPESSLKWYEGITRYQWLVLVVASLGWVFDIFEGQIFVASMNDAMPHLLGVSQDHELVAKWNNYALASFLLGGAFGGILFGMLSDRIGRSKTMIITILFYSVFTWITSFSQAPWHMVALRFLVAMGVGGEWAVASAMVAEVMPKRSRSWMSSVFHATSVFGTLMAVAVTALISGGTDADPEGWRIGFRVGIVPALLVIVIRFGMKEPEQWTRAKEREKEDQTQATGSIRELFSSENSRNTLVGFLLATIGLVTFWGSHIYGKDALNSRAKAAAWKAEEVNLKIPDGLEGKELENAKKELREAKEAAEKKHAGAITRTRMLCMALNTIGGGIGLVLFGWISNHLGRRLTFAVYHAVALVVALIMFLYMIPQNAPYEVMCVFLPIFGFFTLGMHAGYAVYFPELFATRLRGTGTGFCFNAGRFGSAAAMFIAATLSWQRNQTALYLAFLFALGIIVPLMAKETRDEDLPD
ncbi:MAG TPA: MFS transporter [Planctomycetaceae bacterium]|nr:MFS transporter [Planctomycetaceae bacterium]